MATRMLIGGLVLVVILRIALWDEPAGWVAVVCLNACLLGLFVVRYRIARANDPVDAGMTDARVRYGLLALAVAANLMGLAGAPIEIAGTVALAALAGFLVLTAIVLGDSSRRTASAAD